MGGSKKGSISLSAKVRTFAKTAGQFTTDQAAEGVSEARGRVQAAIGACVLRGELVRLERGRFRMATVEDAELHPVAKPQPPQGGEVEFRLNRLASVLNTAHEELSELRRDLRVVESFETSRPSLSGAMRGTE